MMRRLWIEPLTDEAPAPDTLTTPAERAASAAFSPTRRREFLAWRALVRRELGADTQIAYNAAGAPVITNRAVHISVSHGAGYIAVCISDSPCAVDIESPDRNFSRIAPRYISSAEAALSDDARLSAVLWCAKEALYKYAGRPGLDFLHDLHITKVDFTSGTLLGTIENGEPLRLSVHCGEGYIAVVIL